MDINKGKYDDIIDLQHYVSKKHPQMSMEARATQFAAFAALTGYGDAVKETARLTTKRKEIDEEMKKILDEKLKKIKEDISNKPKATFKYFIPDNKKEGGKYVEITGNVEKIDIYRQQIILTDKTKIPIVEIIKIFI